VVVVNVRLEHESGRVCIMIRGCAVRDVVELGPVTYANNRGRRERTNPLSHRLQSDVVVSDVGHLPQEEPA